MQIQNPCAVIWPTVVIPQLLTVVTQHILPYSNEANLLGRTGIVTTHSKKY